MSALDSPLHHLKLKVIAGVLAVVWLLAVACAPAQLTYTIDDDGAAVAVDGRYETVADVVAAAGLSLAAEDDIAPPLDAPADPATPIAVDRAAEVTVIDADSVTTYRTQAETLGDFLAEARLAPPPGARLLADGVPVDANAVAHVSLPARVIFDPYKRVIITDGDRRFAHRTTALTVGEALAESGVALGALDAVVPPPQTALVPEMSIAVERAAPYVVTVDGQTLSVSSGATRVADILAGNGIVLGPLDYTRPAADTTIAPGDAIDIVRVTERIDIEDVAVPFETVYEAAPDLEIDTIVEASTGSNGVLQRRTRVRLENGVEAGREPDGEILTIPPVNRVVRYGTNIVVRTLDTPDGPVEYWRKVSMRVTSYTAATSGKAPDHPAYGITASGVQAGFGVVAVDPTVVPFRSYVYVPGYGTAFAGDTGGGIKGRFIDLGYDEGALKSWRGYVDVYYLGQPPPADQIRWILP